MHELFHCPSCFFAGAALATVLVALGSYLAARFLVRFGYITDDDTRTSDAVRRLD